MKKTLLSILGLTMVGSMSQACPDGGNLFQLRTKEGVVIANYDIRSGELVASSRSYKIIAARPISTNSEQNDFSFGDNLCGESDCGTLPAVEGKDVVFMYRTFGISPVPEYIMVKNLNLGPQVPVPREAGFPAVGTKPPPKPQTGEQAKLRLTKCSTKN